MYDIDFAKKLDEGTAGVTLKGKVTFNLPPKNIVSPKGSQKQYDFWSQFVVIEDSTGSIGANVTFGEEEDKKKNGDILEIKGTIHKYDAKNKKTGETEEKIVINNGKVIETPEEIAKKEEKKNLQKANKEEVIIKEKPINISNNNSQLSNEWEIRKEAVNIAFDYGAKNDFRIYDCFDLAKTIGTYIKSGEVDIKEMVTKVTKLEPKREPKPEPRRELKPKIKPAIKAEEKSAKNNNDLEKLFYGGKEIGLATWVELIGFAVKKEIFEVGTSVEDARAKLLENENDCYESLLDFIDINKDINGLPISEEPTDEVPF